MRSFYWMFLLTLSMFVGGMAIAAQAPAEGGATAAGAACALAGRAAREPPAHFKIGPSAQAPKVTIKDIMNSMMMPAASGVWNAVATTTDQTGVHESSPKTDDDWNAVIAWANMLVETPNLLMVPGRL